MKDIAVGDEVYVWNYNRRIIFTVSVTGVDTWYIHAAGSCYPRSNVVSKELATLLIAENKATLLQ